LHAFLFSRYLLYRHITDLELAIEYCRQDLAKLPKDDHDPEYTILAKVLDGYSEIVNRTGETVFDERCDQAGVNDEQANISSQAHDFAEEYRRSKEVALFIRSRNLLKEFIATETRAQHSRDSRSQFWETSTATLEELDQTIEALKQSLETSNSFIESSTNRYSLMLLLLLRGAHIWMTPGAVH